MKHWRTFKKTELKFVKKKTKNNWITQYEPIFFDSETSKETYFDDYGTEQVKDTWVYIWASSVGDNLFYGRNLREFFDFLSIIRREYSIDDTHHIDIQVHNLSYDISYMWDLLFHMEGAEIHSLFSAPQKIISCETGTGISFKCTYRLSGRSLDKWAKDLGVPVQKQVGMIDYQETHTPADPLSHEQYKYLAYDVLTLKSCYYKEIALQGYTFANCPLTMTGFVRKLFQKAFMAKGSYYKNALLFHQCELSDAQYKRCLKAAAGGMTASSIKYISRKVYHPFGIGHVDFESHYPTQQKCNRFPMQSETLKEMGSDKHITMSDLNWYEEKFNRYYIVEIELKDLKLKKGVTAPFLFKSKCCIDVNAEVIACNGKIVAVNGVVKCCLTNFDLYIIRDQYEIGGYSILACDLYTTRYLPDYVINTIDKLFADKSNFKAKLKADPENADLKGTTSIKKGLLNSVFGCMFTKPTRPDIQIDENFEFSTNYNAETLEDFYEKKSSCMCYQWGVFTTSLARFELFKIIRDVVGYENFLYCDTDSAFYLDNPSIKWRLDEYNDRCRKEAEEKGFYTTLEDGTKKYYHHVDYEDDSGKGLVFKSLHAKCYALELTNGKLKITVAGVSRKGKDGTTREEELGSIDNMVSGFTFEKCGGTRADYSTIRKYEGYSGGGCAVLDTVKTIHEVLFQEGEYTFI